MRETTAAQCPIHPMETQPCPVCLATMDNSMASYNTGYAAGYRAAQAACAPRELAYQCPNYGAMPPSLYHQPAATPLRQTCDAQVGTASAVTDGPAADPIADLCAELRATHCSNENLHDNAAYELERPARTERLLRACMRHETARAERAEAERDALRECVKACEERITAWCNYCGSDRKFCDTAPGAESSAETARFDLAWLISAINVHRHLPRPVGAELPKWYAENDRWLREASEMLTTIHNAEAFIVPSAERNTSQQKHKEDAAQIVDLLHERDALREVVLACEERIREWCNYCGGNKCICDKAPGGCPARDARAKVKP